MRDRPLRLRAAKRPTLPPEALRFLEAFSRPWPLADGE